jgi:hypothetical protein
LASIDFILMGSTIRRGKKQTIGTNKAEEFEHGKRSEAGRRSVDFTGANKVK